MKKILITGCASYQNKGQMKEFLYGLKTRYKDFKIATMAGNHGVDKLAKKYAIEFGIPYGEFNPYHCHHRMYDIMPAYMFEKKYHKINFIYRDSHAVNWCDIFILFLSSDYTTNERFDRLIKTARKKNKGLKIIQG